MFKVDQIICTKYELNCLPGTNYEGNDVLVLVRKMYSDETVGNVKGHRHLGVTLVQEHDYVGGNQDVSDHRRILVRQLLFDITGRTLITSQGVSKLKCLQIFHY